MTTESFDVVILGSGNAGIGVTGPVRRAGMSVALIEPRDLGGTCPNRGCAPKKILVAASRALHEIERAQVHHVAVSKPKLDWAAPIDRKAAMIMNIPTNMARAIEKRQAEVMKPDAREKVDYKPVGVSDVTLGSIDLGRRPAHIEGRELRFRRLTIEPGGVVPWHSHDDRPALIFVQQGEIVEYASNCEVPIAHKTGDIRAEVFGTSHWWKNLGKETVILYVGDVRKDPTDPNM